MSQDFLPRDTGYRPLGSQHINTNSWSAMDSFRTDIDRSLSIKTSSYSSNFTSNDLSINKESLTPEKQVSKQAWWDFLSPAPPTNSNGYNSQNGYGLVDASSAVADGLGEERFADAPDLGGNNWGADLVNAPSVWQQGYTGAGVVVAVLDTGVDRNHEDLNSNIWMNVGEIADNGIDDDGNGYIDDLYGWNFDSNNNNTLDVDGHGTHVSGTIAGVNNNKGVTGIAYDSKIMPVKVLDDNGSGTNSAISKGIYYAVDNGADVINLSLGGGFYNQEFENAVKYASDNGVMVVMAAGNSGGSQPIYPARYAENYGIAVGAVDRNGNMPDFSNRAGDKQISYVTAPGVDIYSTLPNNQYALYSGTSMATPHVAGVVALMLSANPNLSDGDVRQILADTSKNAQSSSLTDVNTLDVSVNRSHQSLAITPDFSLSYDLSETDSRFISFPRLDDYGLGERFQNISYGDGQGMLNSPAQYTLNQDIFLNSYPSSEKTQAVTLANSGDILNPELWSQFQQERQSQQNNDDGGGDDIMDPDLFNRERDRILLEYRDWLSLLPAS